MFAPHRLLLSLAIAIAPGLLAAQLAKADCLPIFYTRYVGNTAADNQCTHNDIQSAISSTVCPTTIYVSNERAWTAQHLDINNKNVTIIGRSGGCGPQACDGGGCIVPTTPEVIIDGAGHTGDSVMYIHGDSVVSLKSLDIRNGYNINGAANTYGGGIHFDGKGSLSLDTVWIKNNTARYGGGINFNGNGGFAGLGILGNTQIFSNSAANSGGGVRVSGDAFMSMLYDGTSVFYNHAPNGYGGGVNIVGPARADVASPGLSSVGVVYSNDAKFGGGVAVTASSDGDALARFFTVDPNRPVRIQGNFASSSGGAVYVKGDLGFLNISHALFCANDFLIDDNAAPEGSALQLDYDTDSQGNLGGDVNLNFASNLGLCTEFPPSTQHCAAGIACNEILNNASVDAAGNPTPGATINIRDGSFFYANRVAMRGNTGGYAIRSDYFASLTNCLIARNNVGRELLRSDSGHTEIDSCTLVDNTILSTNSIYADGPLTLTHSIIDQPGNNALGYDGNPSDLHVTYVLSTDITTLPATESVVLGQPTYLNAAAGDYHLSLHSLGVDFAEAIAGDDRDLDNLPHDQDLPEVVNIYGVRDLGAYERQLSCGANDTLFCNGFESP